MHAKIPDARTPKYPMHEQVGRSEYSPTAMKQFGSLISKSHNLQLDRTVSTPPGFLTGNCNRAISQRQNELRIKVYLSFEPVSAAVVLPSPSPVPPSIYQVLECWDRKNQRISMYFVKLANTTEMAHVVCRCASGLTTRITLSYPGQTELIPTSIPAERKWRKAL